ncbi:hypothetical protein SAMN05444158_6141 [Bradyrhizobium canariense]|uniref:Uncharacterized protein n=1 Tax=Bradyrhizobium canariense TaxID=255045 RepID=A0A1H2AG61_9BRAD|nr:hypothetical protein SAMN05444158_6141 [Bradyrhizobium canariense]
MPGHDGCGLGWLQKPPVGQITVQPRFEKYSTFVHNQITPIAAPSRSPEGRLAIVTNAGRDAVDARGAVDERRLCVDGEVVWS